MVRVAGGAQVIDDHGVFDIGRQNYLALRETLRKAGIMIHGEQVGGTISRTLKLEVSTGRMWLRGGGVEEREFGVSSQWPEG